MPHGRALPVLGLLGLLLTLWPPTLIFAQDDAAPAGSGISVPVCPFLTPAQATQLLGQPVGDCEESPPGAVRQARYVAANDPTAQVLLQVADYGSPDLAQAAFAERRTTATTEAPPVPVLGVGEDGYVAPLTAAHAELVVRQGGYLIVVDVDHALRPPSAVNLGLVVTRVVAAL